MPVSVATRESAPKPERPPEVSSPEVHPPDPAMGSASEDFRASASVLLEQSTAVLLALSQEPVVWVRASASVLVSLVQEQRGRVQLDLLAEYPLALWLPEYLR